MIINKTFIFSNKNKNEGGVNFREIIIKKHNPKSDDGFTKLSHIFSKMPSGLIQKEETGIGATTLELTSKRNSIIVEPTRVTASSKALKHDILYLGGKTNNHEATTNEKIIHHLENKKIKYKKIVVVADSLYRLKDVINNALTKKGKKDKYFFMIDEIDSFQLDSSFRKSMEDCLDIYKKFPKEMRAMVTATSLKLTDPDIKDAVTILKYDEPNYRTINLFYAYNVRSCAKLKITELLNKYPNDKLMIAFNSVNGCYDLAMHLINNEKISSSDIKILCSSNSQSKVGYLFSELSDSILPAKINFCTSAYFTGFDINERYHLISISSIINKIHALSDKRLKQIAGRCRNADGLISETIIFNTWATQKIVQHTFEECKAIANNEIAALNCIKHNYEGYPSLKLHIDSIRKFIVENTKIEGYRFVRYNSNKQPDISYLNIDAYIEQIRVKNDLYTSPFTLYDALIKAGHKFNIFQRVKEKDPIEKNDIENPSRIKNIKDVLESLKNSQLQIENYEKDKDLNRLQKYIARQYFEFKEYLEMDILISRIEEAGYSRDSRILNNLFFAAHYLILDPRSHYKRTVRHHIVLKQSYTSLELHNLWNIIFVETGIHKLLEKDSPAIIKLTKLHFKITKKRTEPTSYIIKKENPLNLKLIKTKPLNFDYITPIKKSLEEKHT